MIVLAVQQGISSLPPTSGQSFTYEYDPETDTFVKSKHLGPVSFRSTQTVGEGRFSMRAAVSYFELGDSLGPIDYLVGGEFAPEGLRTRFGLDAKAHVGLLNLAVNYGITYRLELYVNFPLVVTDADASEVFITRRDAESVVSVELQPSDLMEHGLANGSLVERHRAFDVVGADFNDGTSAGVGRISIGAKAVLYEGERIQIAVFPEFFFPSPNEDEFAGSETAAILPRALATVPVGNLVRLHTDAGYDFDFDREELRRFVWNVGASIPFGSRATIDFGIGGSEFDQGIKWTPDETGFVGPEGQSGTLTAMGDNELTDSFIDFLSGVKLRLGENSVLAGAVNVPLNGEGFRADAVGTLALEFYF